jgi:hypothetical protein
MILSIVITALFIVLVHPSPLAGIIGATILFVTLVAVTGYVNKTMILEVFSSSK